MSSVWLVEEFDDPYLSPYTIGTFASRKLMEMAVYSRFGEGNRIEWDDNSFAVIRKAFGKEYKEWFDFREVELNMWCDQEVTSD